MGQEGIVLAFGEAVTDTGNTTQQYPLGTIRMEETSDAVGIETYRYVYFTNGAGNVAAAAGALCYRGVTQADPWDVTSDVSDVDSAFAVGVFQSVLVDATYGWVKTKGYEASLLRATGVKWAKGDQLHAAPAATDDGKAERIDIAATTKVSGAELRTALEAPVGFAAAASASTTNTTGAAYIDLE